MNGPPPTGLPRPSWNPNQNSASNIPGLGMQHQPARPPQMNFQPPPNSGFQPNPSGVQTRFAPPPVMISQPPYSGADHIKPSTPDSPHINVSRSHAGGMPRVPSSGELLPPPFQGKANYSHTTHVGPPNSSNVTPTNSGPPSRNSSRVPSPIPTQQFDALEGQTQFGTNAPDSRTPPPASPSAGQNPPRHPLNNITSPQPPRFGQHQMNNTRPPHTNNMQPPHMNNMQPPHMNNMQPPPMTNMQPAGPPNSINSPPGFQPTFHMNNLPSMQPGMRPGPPLPGQHMPGPPSQPMTANFDPRMPPPGPPQPGQPPINNMPPRPNMPMPGGPIQRQPMPPRPGQPMLPPRLGMPPPGVSQAPPQPNQYNPGINTQPGQMTNSAQYPNMGPGVVGPVGNQFGNLSINQQIPLENRIFNLLQERNILPAEGVIPPTANLPEHIKRVNCSPDIFRCTLTTVPQNNSILQKCRLPLGITIHPFKDLSHLPVIQSSVIVRCRSCRTYINPFVSFIDQRRWRCNLCFRANELPEEFNFDPQTKTYGSPERRPEIKSATMEFVAPSEYMLRPPQPSVYLFLLDVSYNALQTGYLSVFCETLLEDFEKLPGDGRTLIGFISYNSSVHFYNLSDDLSQPQMLVVSDTDDIFTPLADGLLVNLQHSKELIEQLLEKLPTYHQNDYYHDDKSAMGAALQVALKMAAPTGGRVTVVQSCLPNSGPGALQAREDPNQRASKDPQNLDAATDFYKLLSLEAAGQQIAVDLFLLNSQYADLATIGGVSRHSGGTIYYYPGLHAQHNPIEVERFEGDLKRYISRKIGLEAVMRVRCTKGLALHSFHGNFFVRSTDLLSLPNINPDAGFGMQLQIDENLTDSPYACLQAALLYTSSKGERRIRVHTMCLPVSTNVTDIINGADQQAIISLLAKMASDRSRTGKVSDAREALVNAVVDALQSYSSTLGSSQGVGALPAPYSLRLLPMYVHALLRSTSLRLGVSTKCDDRVEAMDGCKTLPLFRLIKKLVPDLYPVHALNDQGAISREDIVIPQPPRLPLCSASLDCNGVFLLDTGDYMYIWVGSRVSPDFLQNVFDKPDYHSLHDGLHDILELENDVSERLRNFVLYLEDNRPNVVPLIIIKEDSRDRGLFMQNMIEDKTDYSPSYYEFLQKIQKMVKS